MRQETRRLAIGGMMTALAVSVMLLGGVIPAATYCCPAIAGVMLLPVVIECGGRVAFGAWAAIAALSLMLCADKEAALLFAFLGYYPALKPRLDAIPRRWPRRALKFAIMDGAVALMYALIFFVLRLDQVMADFQEMTRALLIAFVAMGVVTLALYDRLLTLLAALYTRRLRKKLKL